MAKQVNPDIPQQCLNMEVRGGVIGQGTFSWHKWRQPATLPRLNIPNNPTQYILDQSSCHRKFDDKALVAQNILVKGSGPRHVTDSVWAGKLQSMVFSDATAKGLGTILQEQRIFTTVLKANDTRVILSNNYDFINKKHRWNTMLLVGGSNVISFLNSTVNEPHRAGVG